MQTYTLHTWLHESVSFIALMLIAALAFFFIEHIRPIQKGQKFTTEKWTEISLALINKIIIVPLTYIVMVFLLTHTLARFFPYQMFDERIQALPFWMQLLLAVFLLDFLVYIRHRLTHKYLWRVHAIHHSTQYVSWLTALRLHPLEVIVDLLFSLTILYFIGFSGEGMLVAVGVLFFFNLLTHTNINLEWPGFLRYLVGGPNYHRWHHAKMEMEAFDKNFAVIFPFIDIMFRTHYHPKGRLPAEYGLYHRENEIPISYTLWGHLSYPLRREANKWKE